jgi:hypothetical protein
VNRDPSCPTAPGANVGRRRALAAGRSGARFEQAVESFNSSEAVRVIGGLSRTLGEPSVSIGAAAGSDHEVRVTVAWDLCWYQWGVDTVDPSRGVFALANGREIAELDVSARQWNGGVADSGRIHLGRPRRRAVARRLRFGRRKIFR